MYYVVSFLSDIKSSLILYGDDHNIFVKPIEGLMFSCFSLPKNKRLKKDNLSFGRNQILNTLRNINASGCQVLSTYNNNSSFKKIKALWR